MILIHGAVVLLQSSQWLDSWKGATFENLHEKHVCQLMQIG